MENWGRRFTAETRRRRDQRREEFGGMKTGGEKRFRAKSAKSAKKCGEKSKSQRARRGHAPTKGGMAASKATLQRLRDGTGRDGTGGREKGNGGQSRFSSLHGFITFAASKLLFLPQAFSAANVMKPLTVTQTLPKYLSCFESHANLMGRKAELRFLVCN